jgi:hydroxymethylpyrimidine pyrophosphatase-like HAD family hydrolase
MTPASPVLAVDLDGTLLHPAPEAIAVWGRTRYQYLSKNSAQLLAKISRILPIAIATARHSQTVQLLVEQLPEVNFCGFVLENGLVTKRSLMEPAGDQEDWTPVLKQLPDWEQIPGYEKCLGLIPPPSVVKPQAILQNILDRLSRDLHLYVDGRKLFLYPIHPNKSMGLRALGLDYFWAAGNDLNDLEMLQESSYSATISRSHPKVIDLVEFQGGYCSPFSSHQGTEDLLNHVLDRVCSQKFTVQKV